jgi:hypothetical protein
MKLKETLMKYPRSRSISRINSTVRTLGSKVLSPIQLEIYDYVQSDQFQVDLEHYFTDLFVGTSSELFRFKTIAEMFGGKPSDCNVIMYRKVISSISRRLTFQRARVAGQSVKNHAHIQKMVDLNSNVLSKMIAEVRTFYNIDGNRVVSDESISIGAILNIKMFKLDVQDDLSLDDVRELFKMFNISIHADVYETISDHTKRHFKEES